MSLSSKVTCRMPGFTKLTLNAHEHGGELLKQFNALRTDGNTLCDCTIMIDDKPYPIHRVFLAACSPYFKALFSSNMKESNSESVTICGISAETFEQILDFMYTGEITLSEGNITRVYPAAKLLQLQLLQNICIDYFINQLCASNCLGIWRYAQTFSDVHLEHCAWNYLCSNLTEVARNEEFLSLSEVELCQIISSDMVDVSTELDMYYAVNRWIKSDIQHKTKTEVLSHVRFSLIPHKALLHLVATDPTNLQLRTVLAQTRNAKRFRRTNSRKEMSSLDQSNSVRRTCQKCMVVTGGYNQGLERTSEFFCEDKGTWQTSDIELKFCEHVNWTGTIGYRLYAIAGHSLTQINLVMSRLTTDACKILQSTALNTDWEIEATLPSDSSQMQFCVMDECIYA